MTFIITEYDQHINALLAFFIRLLAPPTTTAHLRQSYTYQDYRGQSEPHPKRINYYSLLEAAD
jgi:hypothetical protein